MKFFLWFLVGSSLVMIVGGVIFLAEKPNYPLTVEFAFLAVVTFSFVATGAILILFYKARYSVSPALVVIVIFLLFLSLLFVQGYAFNKDRLNDRDPDPPPLLPRDAASGKYEVMNVPANVRFPGGGVAIVETCRSWHHYSQPNPSYPGGNFSFEEWPEYRGFNPEAGWYEVGEGEKWILHPPVYLWSEDGTIIYVGDEDPGDLESLKGPGSPSPERGSESPSPGLDYRDSSPRATPFTVRDESIDLDCIQEEASSEEQSKSNNSLLGWMEKIAAWAGVVNSIRVEIIWAASTFLALENPRIVANLYLRVL